MNQNSVLFEKKGKTHFITFNRPKRKNAILISSYEKIKQYIEIANNDKDTLFTVFSGNGDFFSSGNDFGPESMSEGGNMNYEEMIKALIDHRKILIAFVNGPAIGVACTMLSLFDYIAASDKAYFMCPFTSIGVLPEGTSSLSFEKIMGYPLAARLALFCDRLTAQEMFAAGYVSKVIPDKQFREETAKILKNFEERLAPQSLVQSKELMRGSEWRKTMHQRNQLEKELLMKKMMSEEAIEYIMKRFGSKL